MSLVIRAPALILPDTQPRFLSQADCYDIAQRLARAASGGGYTVAAITSTWRGNVRWARNDISTSGEDRNDLVLVTRNLNGAQNFEVSLNQTTDEALVAAVRRAERIARLFDEKPEADLITHYPPEPFTSPHLFYESTYQLDAERRAASAHQLMQSATEAGMLSAGYIEVSANSLAVITSYGYAQYFQYTWAQYSVTVRDPKGVGSGWAGVDWPDWTKIDGEKLSAIALDKCLKSRNPVAVEPGRYTTILEPQAVCEFVSHLFDGIDRSDSYTEEHSPWFKSEGYNLVGEQVVDERITISTDLMDPDLGFPPFHLSVSSMIGEADILSSAVAHPATWIEHGVLTNLAYDRYYGITELGSNTGLPFEGAFRMSGGDASIENMIATTVRGLLVTRFVDINNLDQKSILVQGYTRDGLWLIENGKITRSVMNMQFTESVKFALNNVEQLGVPQRAFHPARSDQWSEWSIPQPVIVPPIKVRDFSFTALEDAI